ncbi:unnamed protein product [Pedinophyceae sp. YPF-701]|nr:unnamed protein product [Pedinophyceae sp. YPF-701]
MTQLPAPRPAELASRLEDLFNIAITGQDGERGDDAGPATEQLVRNILGLLLPSNLSDLLGASTSGGITAGDFVLGSMDEIIARLADQHDNPRAPGDDVPVAESVQEGDKCIICTDEYEVDQQVIKMPCQHVFHEDCLDKWLNINNTCPVCRHELPEEAEPSRRQSPGNGSGGRPGEDEESGSDYNSSEGSGSEGTFSEGTESEGSGTPSGDGMDHYALDAGLSDALYIIGRRLRGHAAGGRDSGSAAEVDTSFEDSETGESGSESDSMPSLASASELDDSMPSLASASELQSHRSGSPRPPSVGAASRPSRAEGSDDDAGSDVPPPPLPPEAVGSGRVVAPPTGRLPAPGRAAEAAPTAADLRTPCGRHSGWGRPESQAACVSHDGARGAGLGRRVGRASEHVRHPASHHHHGGLIATLPLAGRAPGPGRGLRQRQRQRRRDAAPRAGARERLSLRNDGGGGRRDRGGRARVVAVGAGHGRGERGRAAAQQARAHRG